MSESISTNNISVTPRVDSGRGLPRHNSVRRKTLLNASAVEYADYAINHVQGCAHGCMYPCWAFQQAKRQGKVKSHDEWKQPRIVVDALDLLERDLRKKKGRIERVQLCFTTDPFMVGYPDITDLSLAILKRLHEAEIRVDTLTKGLTPVDLLDTGTYGTANFYGISLVSLDEGFRQRFEPNTALYRLGRIAAIKQLQDAGLKTWVSMEPYPTPNIVEQKIEDVLEAVDFVDRIVFGKWNYSRLASDFPGANAFYVDCVDKVTDFCRTNGIEVYIKEGSR